MQQPGSAMRNREIKIARDQILLGVVRESDARQLLDLGFLKGADTFCIEGTTEWKSLGELDAGRPKTKWLTHAKQSASSAASTVVGSAFAVTGKIKKLATARTVSVAESTALALEGYMPHIKRIVSQLVDTKPVQAVRAGVRDDDLMRKVFGAAYDCLPKPVCRFITEQRFIDFCMQHRQKLLDS